ncbi:MAG TPA: nucleotidyl transferase AbiEii/AbiGii toxin family protein, partial [Acidimicrobiales bacterium]|nr:nucleotidyl transferase AbiEii/AbiGii toxin family protein [Acidimicrobiales bacterium]
LLGGTLHVRGYSIEMVIAEKLVTGVQRGTASTRWRDYFDIYSLTKSHVLYETTLRGSVQRVAAGRRAVLSPLSIVLVGYEAIAQAKWSAWLRRQGLNERIPDNFREVLDWIKDFADPILDTDDQGRLWDGTAGTWLIDT